MEGCLTPDELQAIGQGRGPGRGADRADAHLAECAQCRTALLAALRGPSAFVSGATELTGDGGHRALDETFVVAPVPGRYQRPTTADGALEELGRGGFGKVIVAADQVLGRDVAMKLLTTARVTGDRATAEAMLLREARVMGQLEHPAIVPLHEVGRDAQGALYYTMRRIRGRSLATAVADAGTFTERLRLLPHVLTACHAVAYAHSRGVVHRDLKPQNVMLDRFGATYVIDWGLARAREVPEVLFSAEHTGALRLVPNEETIAGPNGPVGTRAYMSPEQLEGPRTQVDERSDVWGLGAILFEVLTGQPPRDAAHDYRPRRVAAIEASAPADLAAICDKACAEAPGARYPSAEALAYDLDAWLHGRPVAAHAYGFAELAARFVKLHRRTLAVALGAVLALVLGGATSLWRVRTQRNHARSFAHLIVNRVLERLSATRDAKFAAELTTTVGQWLKTTGRDDDASTVAWAWFQLALNSDFNKSVPPEYLENCIAAAAEGSDATARGAWLGCRTMQLASVGDYALNESAAAALRGLEHEPPPPGSADDPHWLIARRHLHNRLFLSTTNRVLNDEGERWAVAAVDDSRRLVAASTDKGPALELYASALSDLSLARSNTNDGASALTLADQAIAVAREAVATQRTPRILQTLGQNLGLKASILRWHAEVAGPDAPAQREAAGMEARRILQAVDRVTPGDRTLSEALVALMLEMGDTDGAWNRVRTDDPKSATTYGLSSYLFAALTSGHTLELTQLKETFKGSQDFDVRLTLGLALLVEGRTAEAAAELKAASLLPIASTLPGPAMSAFAARWRGPLAGDLKRCIEGMNAAFLRGEDAPFAASLSAFADAVDRYTPNKAGSTSPLLPATTR